MQHTPPTDEQLNETDADVVAQRAAQVIASMGADIRALTAERDRYRAAWQSARSRAEAYGEGILRVVEDREVYQRWLKETEAALAEMRATIERLRSEKRELGELAARRESELIARRARIRELERPAVEAQRNEIRDSFAELAATARETGDPEGAFDVDCRLREREEQWAAEDAAPVASVPPTTHNGDAS